MTAAPKHPRKLPDWLAHNTSPLKVLLIGSGGNGSEFFDGLMRLHQALIALGGSGLQVTVLDDDEVMPSNIVRQRFWNHEVGMNKAVALAQRTNMLMGTAWEARPVRYDGQKHTADLVVTAVDNLDARRLALKNTDSRKLWLDMGCDRDRGQVILGRIGDTTLTSEWPNAVAHFPEMLERKDDNRPSCSAAESLSRQDLMINQTVAGAAINLLWKMMRTGQADYNGVMIDLAEGDQTAIPFMAPQNQQPEHTTP
ncbi:PRTRC system ThiF family protein [Marinobacter subterrani]|uniref:PRTRC system ThiF family protein n=1 Tax=Marinobacter subterrani TaxID=1658765 RepID=UPI002356A7AA|nr:PRTRC system ThiF family protein [Marinobacter subterrani]